MYAASLSHATMPRNKNPGSIMNEKKSPCTYIQYFKEKYSLDIQVNIYLVFQGEVQSGYTGKYI